MTTDKYTKSVLTVIAVCLTVLTLQSVEIIPKSYAGETTGASPAFEPAGKNYGLVPLNEDGSINVTIKSAEELQVDGYRARQSGGKLKVVSE
jgi:hypothetical protein